MRKPLIAALVSSCVVAMPAPAAAHFPKPVPARDCGSVRFQPRTDFGASDIFAKGVTCTFARRLARSAVIGRSSLGYYCRFHAAGGDRANRLSHASYRCVRGKRVVTFAVS